MGYAAAISAGLMAAGSIAGAITSAKGQRGAAAYYQQSAEQMRRQRDFLVARRWAEERSYLDQAQAAEFNARQYSLQGRLSLLAGEYNQKLAQRQAVQIKRRAQAVATRLSRRGSALMGGQVVGYLSSGLSLEGTPALVLAETERRLKEDVANALEAGDQQALEAVERGALARLSGLAGAARAAAGAADSWGRASAAFSGAGVSRLMLAQDLWANDMQVWGMQQRARLARLGAWGSLFSGFSRAGGLMAGALAGSFA